jgi:hypothetical protein
MTQELLVRNVFRLENGATVLACEGAPTSEKFIGGKYLLVANDKVRQEVLLTGEHHMLNQTAHHNQRALETRDVVALSAEEAQSGLWRLVLQADGVNGA